MVLNLCGMGPLSPDPINGRAVHEFYDTFHKLADDLSWIGDSLAALRSYEVTKALDALSIWSELNLEDIRLYACGNAGVYGKIAAAIDSRIKSVEWQNGFTIEELVSVRYYNSYDIKSIVLPGAFCYFDFNEI